MEFLASRQLILPCSGQNTYVIYKLHLSLDHLELWVSPFLKHCPWLETHFSSLCEIVSFLQDFDTLFHKKSEKPTSPSQCYMYSCEFEPTLSSHVVSSVVHCGS